MELFLNNVRKILIIFILLFIIISILLWKSSFLLELVRPNVVSSFYDRDPSLLIVMLNNFLFFIYWCFAVVYKQLHHKKTNRFWNKACSVALIANTFLCLYYIYMFYFHKVGMWYLF